MPLLALLLAAGCDRQSVTAEPTGAPAVDGPGKEVASPRQSAVHEGVSVVDEASVLSASEKASLVQRGAAVSRAIDRKLTVVLLRPSEGDSLERVTWAISPAAGAEERPLLLVVDVDTGAVRVDGASSAGRAAAIAGAVRNEVKAGRYAAGVGRGLDRIAQEERSA
jgi:uncharacterized membrane protein YgcG